VASPALFDCAGSEVMASGRSHHDCSGPLGGDTLCPEGTILRGSVRRDDCKRFVAGLVNVALVTTTALIFHRGQWRAPIRVIGESVAPDVVVLLTYLPEYDYKPDGEYKTCPLC